MSTSCGAEGAAATATAPTDSQPPAPKGLPPVAEVPAGMEAAAKLFEEFAEVPAVSKLHVRPAAGGKMWLTTYLTQRNLPANSQRKFVIHTSFDPSAPPAAAAPASLPQEQAADVQLIAPAPSGDSQLVFKSPAATDSSVAVVLQTWRGGRVVSELHVPKTLHGGLIADGYFAPGAAWSSGGGAVAYTAEVPASERTPSWGGPEALKDAAGPKSWRGVGPALEDWGELNTGKRSPAVYVLDTKRREVIKVPVNVEGSTAEGDMSFGQPVWTRDGSGLLLVGWPHTSPNFPTLAKKLGVVFCYNRPAYLYHVPCSRDSSGALSFGAAVSLSRSFLGSAISPTFTPDGAHLLFLSMDAAVRSGTHSAAAALYRLPWPQASAGGVAPEVVVEVVQRPTAPGAFPGLYATSTLEEPYAPDGRTLLLSSQWYSQGAILAVDVVSGRVTPLTPVGGPAPSSYTLLAVSGDTVFASQASPVLPPRLVSASLSGGTSSVLQWTPVPGLELGMPDSVAAALSDLEARVEAVTPTVGDTTLTFESVNWVPKKRTGPLPAIILPHGGPHSAVALGWYPAFTFLASLGYVVLSPNYRGSTGFGEASLSSLPGNIGTHDVQDCMATLQQAVDAGLVDPARVAVIGGSHGGFLTGHLLGQYPDTFKAGVLRNPVCNLSLMVGISDINDWCWVETFGSEEGQRRMSGVPKPDDLKHMFEVSPIAHVEKVKAPMMFMLGAKDRRVPLQDGLQYISALRSTHGSTAGGDPPKVRVITFPEDTHALDRPQTEFEQWVNAAWWLKIHGMPGEAGL